MMRSYNEDEMRALLLDKFKRNISLGMLVAVICLESATRFGKNELHLEGAELEHMLRSSNRLLGTLALLHDDQEHERTRRLTNSDSYPSFENTSYEGVLGGAFVIGKEMFSVVESPEGPRLRFVSMPAYIGPLDGPTKRCPAHRIKDPHDAQAVLNDFVWNLLIDAYKVSGRLSSNQAIHS